MKTFVLHFYDINSQETCLAFKDWEDWEHLTYRLRKDGMDFTSWEITITLEEGFNMRKVIP